MNFLLETSHNFTSSYPTMISTLEQYLHPMRLSIPLCFAQNLADTYRPIPFSCIELYELLVYFEN